MYQKKLAVVKLNMGNICIAFMQTNDKTRKTRKLSINVLYNKHKVLRIKQLALRKVEIKISKRYNRAYYNQIILLYL